PPVVYGPIAVAAGGKLKAHIVGSPSVPPEWSLGNYNSGLHIYYERFYSGTYAASDKILGLTGQVENNDLVGEAIWPTSGRLTFVVTPPRGSGPLFGGTWDQSYTVSVDILELTPTSPAQAGTQLHPGDRLTTTMWNPALLAGQFGSLAQIDRNSEVSVVAGDTIIIQPPPGLTLEPYEVQLARKLLELWNSGYPLPGGLEELLQQIFMDEGAFESNARRFLGSQFTSGRLYEALQILNTERDLYEAAVQVKLLLDGSKEKWTASKLADALWEVKAPDGMDLLEWIVHLSGHAAEAVPVIGWVAAAMDAAQAISLVRSHYETADTAAVQYGEALNIFKASRSWSDEQVANAIATSQQSIEQTEEQIKINRARLEYDLRNLEQQLKADMANGPVDPVPYEIEANKIARHSNNELAALLLRIGADRLKLVALQKYRQGKPKGSKATTQQIAATRRPVRLVLESGAVQLLGGRPTQQDLQVDLLDHTVVTVDGEFLCSRSGVSGYVGCISGDVFVQKPNGEIAKLSAGQRLSVPDAQLSEYDPNQGALERFEGLRLKDVLVGAGRPAPYTAEEKVHFQAGLLPDEWAWQDPNDDALLEFPEPDTAQVTVPDGNDLWSGRSGAPRLLRKVTGDFTIEADVKLQTKATDGASSEWVLFSPGSYEGARAGQTDTNTLSAHYRLFGGGIARWANSTTFADRESFVRLRLTRRGDVWKSYWSLDGSTWHMFARETIVLPHTLWVGWAFKRQAWDRMYQEKAVTTIRNVRVTTAPPGTLPVDEWDFETAEGASIVVEGKVVRLILDGSKTCSVSMHSGRAHAGDFDTVVRFSAEPWKHQPGQSHQFAIAAKSASNANTFAYIRRCEMDGVSPRYDSDLGINNQWNRYQWTAADEFSGYLRIARRSGKISTYYWRDGLWNELIQTNESLKDPMHITLWAGNSERASSPAPLFVEFEVVSDTDGVPMAVWQPEDINLPVLSAPGDVALLPGAVAKVIQAPYPLGNLFFTAGGVGFVFSSQYENQKQGSNVDRRGSLLMVTADGRARTYLRSDLLCGVNRKSGAGLGDGFLVGVDHWPDGGNRYGGLFQLKLDGSFSEVALKEDHGGFSDLIPAAEGGWYFVDFENDNLWRIPKLGDPEARVITSGEVPYGLAVVAREPATGTLYCINWKGSGWPFGGEDAIYRIEDGKVVLFAKAPEGQSFAGMDFARGGRFGTSLYASTGKQIVRVDPEGTLVPVISGAETMGAMRFNPVTGDLLVVYGDKQLLLVYAGGVQG
ncbi:MAG: hypothetical protein ACUVRO_13180, partial [Armatimonadota bacterium]